MWTTPTFAFAFAALTVANFLSTVSTGSVWCYECAFGAIPSTVDVCRPGNFNVSSVPKVSCLHGCGISIFYEFEPNALQAISNPQSENPTRLTINASWIGHNKNIEAITFVARQCAPKRLPRPSCEVKEFTNVHHEECFCMTDYCNGHDGSFSLRMSLSRILIPLTTISILMPHILLSSSNLLKTMCTII